MKEGIKPVREWPVPEKTLLTILTWAPPTSWPAIFSGDYKGSAVFQKYIETVHDVVGQLSTRTQK